MTEVKKAEKFHLQLKPALLFLKMVTGAEENQGILKVFVWFSEGPQLELSSLCVYLLMGKTE